MAAVLGAFLRQVAERGFVWGQSDCLTMGADWVRLRSGFDPAAPYRGRYRSQDEAAALLCAAGGLLRVAAAAMQRFPVTAAPAEGDAALVWAPVGQRHGRVIRRIGGAISLGAGRFAVLTVDRGVLVAPLRLARAWSL